MKPTAFVTFEQADSGLSGAVRIDTINAVYQCPDDETKTAIEAGSKTYYVREAFASVMGKIDAALERIA